MKNPRLSKAAIAFVLGLVLLVGGAQAANELTLTVISQTNSTITLGWTPQPGFGYLFSTNGQLVSRTNDPTRSQVRFAKVANGVYEVAVIVKGATGSYPPSTPPPTSTITQTISAGQVLSGTVTWRATYDSNGDGIPEDPGSVRFSVDGNAVLIETDPPFGDTSGFWNSSTVADGSHAFRVDALNSSNVVVASNEVVALVSNQSSPAGYPDASNTGVPAGTALTSISGDLLIGTAGSVVSGMNVTGVIRITAPGVTVKNSKSAGVRVEGAAGNPANPRATIQNVEIDCGGPGTKGIQATFGDNANNFNAYAVNIHNCEDGLSVENDFTVTDSYIHDLAVCGTCHNDGMQIYGGSRIIIKHNRIYGTDTSAIQFCNNTLNCAPMSDTLVDNNLLAGGGWTLYCPKVSTSNFRVVNNKFSTIFYPTVGLFGAITDCEGETLSGNVIYETGAPVT